MSEAHAWFNLPRRSFESRSHCFLPNGAWDSLFSEIIGVTSEPSPEPAPGLPHFGAYPQADLTPFTLACQHQACPQGVGGAPTNANVPIHSMYHNTTPQGHSASPGQVEEVRQMCPCGCKCELCDSLCVLQRRGHTTHRCLLHKIP